MRERWIHFGAATLFGLAACAANAPSRVATTTSTRPTTTTVATTQPVTLPAPPPERHEPVAPPPPVATAEPVVPVKVAATQPAVSPVTTQPGPVNDKVAYGIGYSVGRRIHDQLHEDGRTADDLVVLKGLIDGLGDRDPAYPPQEVQAAFAEFQAYTQQRRAEKQYAENPAFRKRADDNQQKSRAVLDQNAEMAGVEIRSDGVQVQLLNPGNGRVVGNAHMLSLKNLRVSLADGTLIRESEADKIEQFESADALPALVDAVRAARVGSKWRIWLPPEKAYGLTGKPPVIGPNQAIEYEFELVNAE